MLLDKILDVALSITTAVCCAYLFLQFKKTEKEDGKRMGLKN